MAAETQHDAHDAAEHADVRNSPTKSERSVHWLTPRQRIAAHPSRCRRAKRCAAIAIATAASSAVKSETSVKKVARAVDGLAHLRLAVLQRFEVDAAQLAAVDARARPRREALDLRVGAGDQQPVRHAAPVADEAGAREFVRAHHQARREVDEAEAAIQLARDDRRRR